MATGREWDLPESAVTDRKFSLRRALLKRAAFYGGIAGAGYLGWNWYRGFDREVLVAGRDPSKNALEFARAAEAEFRGELLKATDQAEVARHVN
ncbi:MAG TPA: hypothetical protein VNC50_21635, partial [Planctomycetia bacterium]|nr:hypothetical protein [Planctomycetia bacterium]